MRFVFLFQQLDKVISAFVKATAKWSGFSRLIASGIHKSHMAEVSVAEINSLDF
jgi:hypothetical protein